MTSLDAETPRRVVALGASNLTRGLQSLVRTATTLWGPVEVLAALGHGRSYGMTSRILVRELPGILQCGIWAELDRLPPAPTRALLTDVGNDIVYGASVAQILEWIEECAARLDAHGIRPAVTGLPVFNLGRLPAWKFHLFRTALWPSCRLDRDEVARRAEAVHSGLQALAARRGLDFVPLRPDWYGFDPIHVRLRLWSRAWRDILLAGHPAAATAEVPRASVREWVRLYGLRPERRWMFGREQYRAQPALATPAGLRLWSF
jgi:hypothetical protein